MLLLPYQKAWVSDCAKVRVAEKSRRIGFTYATALRAVLRAASPKGCHQFYIGYNQDLAEEFIRNCEMWARNINVAMLTEIGTSLYPPSNHNKNQSILTKKIRFPSGYRIEALTSNARNLRGKQGDIIIDEAAFHDDLPSLLKAAFATLIWGSTVSIMSTHNGVQNAFNTLVTEIESGKLDYSFHRVTFDDALDMGLYDQVARVRGLDRTMEAQTAWRQEIIAMHGESADEELFCKPGNASMIYLTPALIGRSLSKDYKVIRYGLEDSFAMRPEEDRERIVLRWYNKHVLPIIRKFDKRSAHYIGQDFGRKSDLSSIAIGCWSKEVTMEVPIIIEIQNMPFEQQKSLLVRLCQDIPKFSRGCLDAGGNGAYLAEVMTQRFGPTLIESVHLNIKWYADNLPILKSRFEEGILQIPEDADVRDDLLQFEFVEGVPRMPSIRKDSKATGKKRHGDSAIAIALLEAAMRPHNILYEYEKVERGGVFNACESIW